MMRIAAIQFFASFSVVRPPSSASHGVKGCMQRSYPHGSSHIFSPQVNTKVYMANARARMYIMGNFPERRDNHSTEIQKQPQPTAHELAWADAIPYAMDRFLVRRAKPAGPCSQGDGDALDRRKVRDLGRFQVR